MDPALIEFLEDGSADKSALHDVPRITAILVQVAREGRAVSYSELLLQLGFRFTRPKMRAVCKTLDAIDREAETRGEPGLAALVVRESDRLPGQGWWVGRDDYKGAWEGAEAQAYLVDHQQRVWSYWQNHQLAKDEGPDPGGC
ncbi:MAG: ribose-phosphate pyrophosphokinase [Sphingorhabdus sp.]